MYSLRYHMYLILEKVELKEAIAFVFGNGLSAAPKADAEKGSDDRAVVERSMIHIRSEDNGHGQVGIALEGK